MRSEKKSARGGAAVGAAQGAPPDLLRGLVPRRRLRPSFACAEDARAQPGRQLAPAPPPARCPLHHAALLLVLCCSLVAAACGDGSVESSPRADDGEQGAATAPPPDLSYPGEEQATDVPESPTEAVPPSVPPPLEEVRIFLVELEEGATGGEQAAETPRAGDTFGCGDRLRAVAVPVATEGVATEGRVAAALGSLLEASGGQGLYTALERSQLEVERVEPVAGVEGLYRVHLTGQLRLGGVCDNPRVRAQLEATARQFAGVEDVEISIDGQPLESFLTGRG